MKKKIATAFGILALSTLAISSASSDIRWAMCRWLDQDIQHWCDLGYVNECNDAIDDYNAFGCDNILPDVFGQ